MRWTTDTPIREGWYWLQYAGTYHAKPEIQYLLACAGDLWMLRPGHPIRVDEAVVDAHAGGNPLVWAGPIPEPEEVCKLFPSS